MMSVAAWLVDRFSHIRTDSVYQAYVNGVEVGEIPGAVYRNIVSSVLSDPSVHVRQLVNLVRAICNMLGTAVLHIPIAAFWLAWACVVLDPSWFANLMVVASHSPELFQRDCLGALTKCITLWLFGEVLRLSFGGWAYGLKNYYIDEVHDRARSFLKVPAFGYVELYSKIAAA